MSDLFTSHFILILYFLLKYPKLIVIFNSQSFLSWKGLFLWPLFNPFGKLTPKNIFLLNIFFQLWIDNWIHSQIKRNSNIIFCNFERSIYLLESLIKGQIFIILIKLVLKLLFSHCCWNSFNNNCKIWSWNCPLFNDDYIIFLKVLKENKNRTPNNNNSKSKPALNIIEILIFVCPV